MDDDDDDGDGDGDECNFVVYSSTFTQFFSFTALAYFLGTCESEL
jgi:hypothetical protein